LLNGLFDAPPANETIRAKWEAEGERIGKEALHARLKEVDPKAAAKLHFNDVRRVVRALEVYEATGRPISSFQQTWDAPPFRIPAVAIEWPTDELNRRIDMRVQQMADAGWPEETRRLLERPMGREASQALGYREWQAFLRGEASRTDTVALIQLRTRQFAKRQRTWFRQLPNLRTIPAGSGIVEQILNAWQEESEAGANGSRKG
jgi:tRNA dimethylallyltransferase